MFSKKKKLKQDKRKKEYACRDEDRNIEDRNYLIFKRKMIISFRKKNTCRWKNLPDVYIKVKLMK